MQPEGDNNKGQNDELKHSFAREFDEKELAALVDQVSPDEVKFKVVDDFEAALMDVVNWVEIPEASKWEVLAAIKEDFESGDLDKARVSINSNETKQALGNEVIYTLNYLLRLVKEGENIILDEALKTEDTSSEPVQVQILNNIMNAIKIPNIPLGEIEDLYNAFETKAPSADYSEIINQRMKDIVDLFKDNLNGHIDLARLEASKNLERFRSAKSEEHDTLDVYGRVSDYWATMTPAKLYQYLVRRITLENMAESHISFAKVRELAQKLFEMKNTNPTGYAEEN